MDWIEQFLEFTEGITSPELFRLWCGISTVAGSLERRVWVRTAQSEVYPNLFVLLVAPPGVGKSQAIAHVGELWYGCSKFKIAPDNVTKAALVDALQDADKKIITKSGLVEYHSLLVPSSEFGVLVPAHDLEFLNVLNHVYDNPRVYRENRRSLNKQVEIIKPQLNILAGTQPGFLASLLPDEAWTMGFTSRIIMVYAGTAPTVDLFSERPERSNKHLIAGLRQNSDLMGGMSWTPEAKTELERWNKERCAPIPEHSKLQHYIPRRILHIIKLAMVSAISRNGELVIHLEDVERARDWLLGAEQLMPDIFREMVGRSDSQVIQDLHLFLWKLWITGGKKPLHETRLVNFLQTRVPSDKILRIIDIAERSNIIARVAGSEKLYIPRARHEHGVE